MFSLRITLCWKEIEIENKHGKALINYCAKKTVFDEIGFSRITEWDFI